VSVTHVFFVYGVEGGLFEGEGDFDEAFVGQGSEIPVCLAMTMANSLKS
jgi:hypothetical protein